MIGSRDRAARQFAIEAHPSTATLYLYGATSVAGLLEVMQQCEALPESVWLLRVDLSAAHPLDAGTMTVLSHALRRWRDARSGMTHMPSELRGASQLCTQRTRRLLTNGAARRDSFVEREGRLKLVALRDQL